MAEANATRPALGSMPYVCDLEELEPGAMRRFDLDGIPLAVCRSAVTGEVFAIDARCPHQGALLCKGVLTGIKLGGGRRGEDIYLRRGEIVECPAHRWGFDVRTGHSIGIWPPMRTPTFAVRIEDGGVYVGRR